MFYIVIVQIRVCDWNQSKIISFKLNSEERINSDHRKLTFKLWSGADFANDKVDEAEDPYTVEHDDEVHDVHDAKDGGFRPVHLAVPHDGDQHSNVHHVD